MTRFRTPLLIIAISCIAALPLLASAQIGDMPTTIVPPDIQDCPANWNGLVSGFNNLIKFVLSFAVIIAILVIAYAGFLLVLTPANPENRGTARGLLLNAAIGLVLALSAWLIVNTILTAVTGKDIGTFTGFISSGTGGDCILPKGGTAPTGGGGGISTGGGTGTCANCVSLATAGIENKGVGVACNVSGGRDGVPVQNPPLDDCVVDKDLAAKLKTSMKSGMWVTEAWPPTRNHHNPCHANGTCVDVDYKNNRSDAASINAFISSASSAGLGVVYELSSASSCKVLLDAGVPAKNLDVVPGITGPHFSVYSGPVNNANGGCN